MEYIVPYKLTEVNRLHSLVEHRSKFNLDFCELNVFETRQQATDFNLKFDGFTITSMLRGKKIMHLEGFEDFEYVPGETVLAPAETLMRIDFPEAEMQRPTQCTALVLDTHYLNQQLERINSTGSINGKEWKINPKELIIKNNKALASTSTRILEVLTSNDPFKEYQADLMLRELVLTTLKVQNLNLLQKDYHSNGNRSPFEAVLTFITNHITSDIRVDELCRIACMSKSSFYRAFTEEYGISPAQLILDERIKFAKTLLKENYNLTIKEAAYASGFNDPNYFTRAFRKSEGITPTEFREKLPI